MSQELALQGLLGVIEGARTMAAYSKANRDKPGNGKVGAVGFNLGRLGVPVVTASASNQRTVDGPLEDDANQTLPDVVHAEMAVLLGSTSAPAFIACTESPCMNCAVHMEAAQVNGVFWLEDYRMQQGVEFLKGRGWSAATITIQGVTVKALFRNIEEANEYRRLLVG